MEKNRGVFAERLIALRKEKGFESQQKFAEKLGVSRGLIGNYEQGTRKPDHEMLCLIANFFNVSVDYLLGQTNIKKNLSVTKNELSPEIHELIKIYNGLSMQNRIAWLERGRTLLDIEKESGIYKKQEV
ncbi:helix-turn-helix transcriptional regulator [Sinanaerobacter sp. ZZT-01]|uniref:helix-turn-helix domain-containing protein n=1 Tax=Sinanaerobacter sp. ZZT-01 TaxID=3111540 RepID=UPI002D79B3BD|nr:helix-turn-helix transcriptional regulator [Sinanaerobacter sp. ZZT-01]WRR94222.1 helix-turn-helix transcriptional regulator [Sinanaerobacter sp. ZZT-01]